MALRRIAVTTLVPILLAPLGPVASAAPPRTALSTVASGATSEPVFGAAEAIPVGPTPEATAIGDVTGDGRADVLLGMMVDADPSDVYDLLVFAQQADGSLGSPVRYRTGLSSGDRAGMGVAVLDANGDGRRDVALSTRAGVQLLTQTAEGKLAMGRLVAGTTGAEFIAAADMDRDGDADLVVNGEAGTQLLRQDPVGVFVASPVGPEWGYAIAVGDVDSDGWPDIAVCGQRREVLIYHHAATGWTRTAHTPEFGYWDVQEGIEIADVNGDRRADVAVTVSGNVPGALLNVFLQTSTGGLAAPVVYQTPDIPQPVKAADLNADGRQDLVIAHGGWLQVSVLLQTSGGTLGAPVSYPVPFNSNYHSQGLALGDINGDKRVDAVLADRHSNLVVLRNGYRAGTALSGATSATSVTYGATVTVSGRLTRSDTGAGIPGVPVQLYARRKGTTSWLLVGAATSTGTGAVTLTHPPRWSVDYRWNYRGSGTFLGSASALRPVGVRTAVGATLSRTSIALGGPVTLSGAVAPGHPTQVVYLQRLVNGSWTTVTSRPLTSISTYEFPITPSSRGTYSYRIYKPADTDHLAGYSGTRSLTVS